MSTFEQPFIDAIAAKEIDGVIIEGRHVNGAQYSKALGSRTLLDGTKKSLSSEDITYLASATKLLTTIAVLQCCEKGLLSLDADLKSLLPDLIKQGVLLDNVGSSDVPKSEPVRNPLTLRHLLVHSCGLPYEFGSPLLQRWRTANPVPLDASEVSTRYLRPLAFQPGDAWAYGIGLDWAGYLVEKVSGIRLDEYFRTYLLKPVGVAASEISFFPVKEGLGERMPDLNPQDKLGHGLSAAMGSSVHGDVLTGCFGGQGGYASAQAYIAILQSLLADDGKLLKSESIHKMSQPQLEKNAKQSFTSALHGPFGSFMSQNTSGTNRDFGLGGLLVGDEEDGGFGTGTLTWGGGCNSAWFIDRTNGVCGFASLQLGLPPNIQKALELKGVFRKNLKEQLKSTNTTKRASAM